MNTRILLEILVVLATCGLLLELAAAHTGALVAAGVVAAVWIVAKSLS